LDAGVAVGLELELGAGAVPDPDGGVAEDDPEAELLESLLGGGAAGAAGAPRGSGETGAASKAATISNCAMKPLV